MYVCILQVNSPETPESMTSTQGTPRRSSIEANNPEVKYIFVQLSINHVTLILSLDLFNFIELNITGTYHSAFL